MKRTFCVVLFAGLLCLGTFVTQSEAKPDTVKPILPGIWFREGDLTGKGHCNNIVIEMKDANHFPRLHLTATRFLGSPRFAKNVR